MLRETGRAVMFSRTNLHFAYLQNFISICYVHNLACPYTVVKPAISASTLSLIRETHLLVHVINANANCPSVSLELLHLGQLHNGPAHVP